MNIRRIRKARGLTMKELGNLIGVSEAAIGQYETGKRKPDYEKLLMMGEALNCSVNDLLMGTLPPDLCNQAKLESESVFSDIEIALINCFRDASERDKELVLHILKIYDKVGAL